MNGELVPLEAQFEIQEALERYGFELIKLVTDAIPDSPYHLILFYVKKPTSREIYGKRKNELELHL